MLSLLVSLLCCSCCLAESNIIKVKESYRFYNKVTLTCKTDSGTEQNPQWRFNGHELAESQCYDQTESSSDGSIIVTVTPKCEGVVSCSASGVTDNKESIPHELLGNHNIILNASNIIINNYSTIKDMGAASRPHTFVEPLLGAHISETVVANSIKSKLL